MEAGAVIVRWLSLKATFFTVKKLHYINVNDLGTHYVI